MPRPGPRPYECVRRAWHSDRHQPIRGSIIQEIFRLANEVHSNATRKNKEWQEKLPFVVLKAEEIMYSKANSEAEYMDLKTLWDRANDAIDTIIRKDDANESGDLLQPCIEAALNLGCIPRRASRSQRHSNPVSYLSPNFKEPADVSPKPQHNSNPNQLCSKIMPPPLLPIQSSNLHVSATQFGSKYSAVGPEIQFMPSNSSKAQKRSPGGFPMPVEPRVWPDLGFGVYPLYYCEGHSLPTSQSTKPSVQSNGGKTSKLNAECDLSLRLGLPSPPSSEAESSWTHEVEDVGSSSSCDKGFDFFSGEHIDERHESCSSKWSSQGDCTLYMSGCDKNQKVHAAPGAVTGALTDECFSWKP